MHQALFFDLNAPKGQPYVVLCPISVAVWWLLGMATDSTCFTYTPLLVFSALMKNTAFGTLLLGLCCHYHVDQCTDIILTGEELGSVAFSCRFVLDLLCDKSDQQADVLPRQPLAPWPPATSSCGLLGTVCGIATAIRFAEFNSAVPKLTILTSN